MVGYEPCPTERERGCWLRSPVDFSEYNIYTDYERITPKGIHRYYTLNATQVEINADGIIDSFEKVFLDDSPDAETQIRNFQGPGFKLAGVM